MPAPLTEHLRKEDYEVRTCQLVEAYRLVELFHYARSTANTATYRHGLYRRSDGFMGMIVGAALWQPPMRSTAESLAGDRWRGVLTLSRLVIVPEEPTNAASFLLGASIRLIRRDGRFHTLLTYADDSQGHTGTIYRATNWQYVGTVNSERVYRDKAGRQASRKAGNKTRTHAEMLALGYRCDGARPVKHKFVMPL